MEIINNLIKELQNLPGLGPRSAKRIALHLLTKQTNNLITIAKLLENAHETIIHCHICGNIDTESPCYICTDDRRKQNMIAIIENISDLWAIERSGSFKGCYHVLGGVLSAIEGVGPEHLKLHDLHVRVTNLCEIYDEVELILATNLTVEGQTTTHYINRLFADMPIKMTRLAHGLPVGGELDYMDDSTIITAINERS